MPVVTRRVRNDTERRIKYLHYPFEKFDDDSLPAWLGDNEMDRSGKAERGLDNWHNTNRGQAIAGLVNGRKVRQQILSNIGRTHGLRGLSRIILLKFGEAGMVE